MHCHGYGFDTVTVSRTVTQNSNCPWKDYSTVAVTVSDY